MIIRNRKFLVIGTALSGIAAAKYLISKDAYVIVTDIKPREKLDKEVLSLERYSKVTGIFGTQPPLSILSTIDYIIMSPGVPLDIPIVKEAQRRNIEILSEIELAFRLSKTPIIAITGTNGKTTTTALVGEIFKASKKNGFVVGNIGTPMISYIDRATQEDFFIAEISSFQLEGVKAFRPYISAILNITPDHLNRHKTMDNYIQAKSRVFQNQRGEDVTVLNGDDPITASLMEKVKGKGMFFSRRNILEQGVFVKNDHIVIREQGQDKIVCPTSALQILGNHNLENALAAVALTYKAHIPVETIKRALEAFSGVSHRIELVDTINGVDYINDSKGTNPEASMKAIEAMKKPIILIAGGMDKGSDFTEFIRSFNGKVRHLILLGETAEKLENTAIREGFSNITKVKDVERAVFKAFEVAREGEVVLLSPACASWDMFNNFEERGNLFKDVVKSLRRV